MTEEEIVAWEKALIRETLDQVSRGFSNKTDGAGIRMYYVLDKLDYANANPEFDKDITTILKSFREDPMLKGEFVHLFLARHFVRKGNYGRTVEDGSTVFVEKLMNDQPGVGSGIKKNKTNFVALVSHLIAHELTHTIIREDKTNGFDAKEHVKNGDEDGKDDEVFDDGIFLMATPAAKSVLVDNWTKIKFSDTTRNAIDLTNKQLGR